MDESISAKLDAFRLLAAICVVAAHSSQLAYTGPGEGALVALGRAGVIAFFLLSGYVIAYVSEYKHAGLKHFMVARLARLHSVFIPALLVTWIADVIGRRYAPELYSGYPLPTPPDSLAMLPIFASFMHESVGHGLRWLSNGPLWSIAYEFWYYVLFGVGYFLRGALRIGLVGLAALVAGYKILLLFPLWLGGVALYRYREHLLLVSRRTALSSAACGLVALVALCHPTGFLLLASLRELGLRAFGTNYSAFLAWDIVIAVPLCLIMVFVIRPDGVRPGRLLMLARLLAGATFSIYCFHVPLLLLFRAMDLYRPDAPWSAFGGALAVLVSCLALSLVTERQKKPWMVLWARLIGAGSPASPHVRSSTVRSP